MNVLSLFDGMSCGQIALNAAGVPFEKYYASEIKAAAIKVTKANFPNTIHVGNVETLRGEDLPRINLLIGGSPCQDLTFMGMERGGLEGKKSSLFYEYVRLKEETKAKIFLFENVASMKIKDRDIITKYLGVEPILINSLLVSGQERRRLYWTNIPGVKQPEDRGIKLRDLIDYNAAPEENLSEKKKAFIERTLAKGKGLYVRVDGEKSMPITAKGYGSWNTQFITMPNGQLRDLTLSEYKRLQTTPEDYIFPVIKSKATELIGDGWTVDVIAHIFSYLPTAFTNQLKTAA